MKAWLNHAACQLPVEQVFFFFSGASRSNSFNPTLSTKTFFKSTKCVSFGSSLQNPMLWCSVWVTRLKSHCTGGIYHIKPGGNYHIKPGGSYHIIRGVIYIITRGGRYHDVLGMLEGGDVNCKRRDERPRLKSLQYMKVNSRFHSLYCIVHGILGPHSRYFIVNGIFGGSVRTVQQYMWRNAGLQSLYCIVHEMFWVAVCTALVQLCMAESGLWLGKYGNRSLEDVELVVVVFPLNKKKNNSSGGLVTTKCLQVIQGLQQQLSRHITSAAAQFIVISVVEEIAAVSAISSADGMESIFRTFGRLSRLSFVFVRGGGSVAKKRGGLGRQELLRRVLKGKTGLAEKPGGLDFAQRGLRGEADAGAVLHGVEIGGYWGCGKRGGAVGENRIVGVWTEEGAGFSSVKHSFITFKAEYSEFLSGLQQQRAKLHTPFGHHQDTSLKNTYSILKPYNTLNQYRRTPAFRILQCMIGAILDYSTYLKPLLDRPIGPSSYWRCRYNKTSLSPISFSKIINSFNQHNWVESGVDKTSKPFNSGVDRKNRNLDGSVGKTNRNLDINYRTNINLDGKDRTNRNGRQGYNKQDFKDRTWIEEKLKNWEREFVSEHCDQVARKKSLDLEK
ncbi:hypothetical protein VP01_3888g1 [Puccinia sorghi]|uniref:Uncharacterized protein n=1 Tax=Puccinia sorghi TaxID=27349 RepID=A0A0L6UST5_9BASI|nr:hypothetical protein VP01_3888g1 [Puccinia sorghi]